MKTISSDKFTPVIFNVTAGESMFESYPTIEDAILSAEDEIQSVNETIDTIGQLKTRCDKTDYVLAASSGVICGLIDIFLVGKPKGSVLGALTDKWFDDRILGFTNKLRWFNSKFIKHGKKGLKPFSDSKAAKRWLQLIFKIPYDQTHWGPAAESVFILNTDNHHFVSLPHNPSLLGLFFSILDQFNNTSHFVVGKEVIELIDAKKDWTLLGKSVSGKIFRGFCNWFGHIISDVGGSSGAKGRGAGIPSPLWTWMNDIIVLKSKLGISPSDFDEAFNNLALNIYLEGYDARFQTTQAIPVIINSLIVRIMYSVRRLLHYYSTHSGQKSSFRDIWRECKPFNNAEVSRMLTVAHGTFCILDITDATIRGFATAPGEFNPVEFCLRLNLIGVGRFSVSLFGEIKRGYKIRQDSAFAKRKKIILESYLERLSELSQFYDDSELLTLIDDLKNQNYETAFEKSYKLPLHRGAKSAYGSLKDVDSYFKPKE